MIAAGVNAKALSEFLGHSSVAITLDRYGHLMPGAHGEAADLLDAYLARSVPGLNATQREWTVVCGGFVAWVPSRAAPARLGWTVEPEDVAEGVEQLAYRPAGVDGEWATMRRGAQFEQLLARPRPHWGQSSRRRGCHRRGFSVRRPGVSRARLRGSRRTRSLLLGPGRPLLARQRRPQPTNWRPRACPRRTSAPREREIPSALARRQS